MARPKKNLLHGLERKLRLGAKKQWKTVQSMSRFTGLQLTSLSCLPGGGFRATPSPRFTGGMPVYRGGSFFHARGAPPAAAHSYTRCCTLPGRPAHPAAIEAVQAWAELEDQLEIVEALTKDAIDVLNERINGTFADDANPSDNELELAGTENVESEGGRRLAPPPSFSELSSLFGPLEKYAESCGISGAAYYLRKAKMDFIHARSSKPAVQANIRAMFSDS